MYRELDPTRLVVIKRKLRYPEDKIVYETMPYWMAQGAIAIAMYEENTASLWIKELEDAQS